MDRFKNLNATPRLLLGFGLLIVLIAAISCLAIIVGEIAVVSSGQSAGIEQVNTAVTQMDHVTQSNSTQTEELSATAQTLSGQAAPLTQLVGRFKTGKLWTIARR
jgi:methyl-accepting chemotaxis protein